MYSDFLVSCCLSFLWWNCISYVKKRELVQKVRSFFSFEFYMPKYFNISINFLVQDLLKLFLSFRTILPALLLVFIYFVVLIIVGIVRMKDNTNECVGMYYSYTRKFSYFFINWFCVLVNIRALKVRDKEIWTLWLNWLTRTWKNKLVPSVFFSILCWLQQWL